MAFVIDGKKNFIQWRTIVVSIGIIVMVSCSGGGRSDLTLIPARKNVNFKPRNMVVVMMEGELSVDVKSLRGNIRGKERILAKLTEPDSCWRQARVIRYHVEMCGKRNPLRYWGWEFWLILLSKILAKTDNTEINMEAQKSKSSWEERSKEPEWTLVKERIFVSRSKECHVKDEVTGRKFPINQR